VSEAVDRRRYEDPQELGAIYAAWDARGPETKDALLGLLPDDWSFQGKRILDFGCGAGRTLRYFSSEAETSEFWGVDIDAAFIKELNDTLCPPMHAARCHVSPPLDFKDGHFDLAWAISVFTHLTDNSFPWLLELHRVLKPGGLLIATYMGRWNSELLMGEPWNENVVGMNVLHHTQPWDRGGPNVVMSDWWVRAHWGRAFDILAIVPRIHNQSWALLRRREVELTTDDLEQPEDDPREYLAARRNLEQVRRELEYLEAVSSRQIEDVRREYEASLSWRITRPLRAAASAARAVRAGHSR
jgi:SAM-dependent methyltransferase